MTIHNINYPFSAIVGQDALKTALLLCAVDPGLGGVLIEGPRGTAKSTSARALADLLPEGRLVTLPLGTSEERLTGSLDLQQVLDNRNLDFRPGLLHQAHRGVLYVDEVNLLPDHLVDLLLDVASCGINRVERDGLSHQHAARFVLVGTMNPDEGELRPQLLDRFGLCVRLDPFIDVQARTEILSSRLCFEDNPQDFVNRWQPQQEAMRNQCIQARSGLSRIRIDPSTRTAVAERCVGEQVDGVRADLTLLKAARAHAALQNRETITQGDIDAVAEFALVHRRRSSSSQNPAPPEAETSSPQTDHQDRATRESDWGAVPPMPVETGQRRQLDPAPKKKV